LNWTKNLRTTGFGTPKKTSWTSQVRENIAAVGTSVEQSSSRSARKHAYALGTSDRTARRISHCDLKLHSYKITIAQELSPADRGKRKDCCNAAVLKVVPPNGIVWSSDEAHFYISDTVKKQNSRYRAAENPRTIHRRTSSQSQSHRLVCFVHGKHRGTLFFRRGWRHCYCDFQPVLRDV